MKITNHETVMEEAIALAKTWQDRVNALLTSEERTYQKRLSRLLSNPIDKIILTQIVDQSFRSKRSRRIADQISRLLKKYGTPRFLSPGERLLTLLFMSIGKYFPRVSVPIILRGIRKDSGRFILSAEKDHLLLLLRERRDQDVRMNINHLGEAVLGEEEALCRVNAYLDDLKKPEVECISVKISTLYSQISPLAFEHSVSVLKERISMLYREAMKNPFVRRDGSRVQKFVNMDMEEYRDLEITAAVFTGALDEKELNSYSAGMALQSYLPDSYDMQKKLTEWAKKRVSGGGGPIRIRIVKGANMEMEKVESAIHNWPLAPFDNKLEVDANFKRMIEFGTRPENIEAVHLGIGSHNLFDLAYAYTVASHRGVSGYLTFEILEGMADSLRKVLQETTGNILVYAPVALKSRFIHAVAYLIRRLDENTGRENFLRYARNLRTDSPRWSFLNEQFMASWNHMDKLETKPNRTQDRLLEISALEKGTYSEMEFVNEPDTDWSLSTGRKWAQSIRDKWKKKPSEIPYEIPIVVAGNEVRHTGPSLECLDPSQVNLDTGEKTLVAQCAMVEESDIGTAVEAAKADPDAWRQTSLRERRRILSKVADILRRTRGDLIGSAAAGTGKTFIEADAEVSEAIDFVEYYPYSMMTFAHLNHVAIKGKGVGVVISPWNFPIAIPCGGISASLAAGNTVILKPSSWAIVPAWELCRCFWKAGISKNTLQFLPCNGSAMGEKLTKHSDVDFVIFTGGTDTALKILHQRPDLDFSGETGGKNATIVTAVSDRDQAIRNVIHSAFGNSGQKCSATSLLILEREVYKDKGFKRQLVDAAKSWGVGSVWDFENKMGPLIHPPQGKLKKALTELESGEEWALKPGNIDSNPHLWTPGIKWGVRPGSDTHLTEFFGPILGVMQAKDLEEAIKLTNLTGYGLTSGLESLDSCEQEYWKNRIRCGNLYINRPTSGALVLRQPFGGMGKSAMGAGIKAGGSNYVLRFAEAADIAFPHTGAIINDHPLLQLSQEWRQKLDWGGWEEYEEDLRRTISAVRSYLFAKEQEFSGQKDYFHLRGQDNLTRYMPIGMVAVRLHYEDSLFDILARIAAVRISECGLTVSIPPDLRNRSTKFLFRREAKKFMGNAEIRYEPDTDLIDSIPHIQGIRYGAPDRAPQEVLEAAAGTGFYVSRTPVVMEGRIELLQYYQEQSICINYHRYGNLGERGVMW